MMPGMTLTQLKRIRWAVRSVLLLGVAASVVANVLHALPNPISQSIAAWPPLALLLTVELISRIPVHSRQLAVARLTATALIAGIAGWVSYWHMAGVASRYGEQGAAPYLIPVSVDGLIIVASICLVEIGGRMRVTEGHPAGERVTRYDYPAPIGPMPGIQLHRSIKPQAAAATEKQRRVRHHRLVRTLRVTHPQPRVTAAQEPRQDPRATHEVDLVVCAIRDANPKLPQRQIARLAGVSDATVRRALRRSGADEATQQPEPVPDLQGASV
jgi:hypothetical protein